MRCPLCNKHTFWEEGDYHICGIEGCEKNGHCHCMGEIVDGVRYEECCGCGHKRETKIHYDPNLATILAKLAGVCHCETPELTNIDGKVVCLSCGNKWGRNQ